jgi:hypothetical protein
MVTTRAACCPDLTSGVILMTAHDTPEVTKGALD